MNPTFEQRAEIERTYDANRTSDRRYIQLSLEERTVLHYIFTAGMAYERARSAEGAPDGVDQQRT